MNRVPQPTPHQHALLKRAKQARMDPRFASFLTEHHQESITTIQDYLKGVAPLATATKGNYKVVIMPDAHILYLLTGWEPAPAGCWMDLRESHWELTYKQYKKLSRPERAALEAKEQLQYIKQQFKSNWLEFYFYEEHAAFWWDAKGMLLSEKAMAKVVPELADAFRSHLRRSQADENWLNWTAHKSLEHESSRKRPTPRLDTL